MKRKFFALLTIFLSLMNFCVGQEIKTLAGKIKTYYTEDKGRAETMQHLLENCASYYETNFPGKQFNVDLRVMNKTDWANLPYPIPYGMPHYNDRMNSIIVASNKNEAAKFFGYIDTTGNNTISPLDQVAIHELGHYFLNNLFNAKDSSDLWANEFMASYFAICYFKSKNETWALPGDNIKPVHRSLEDFNTLYTGVGPQNYSWYQRQFVALGNRLYPKFKLELVSKYINKDKNTSLLMLLNSIAPNEVMTWQKEMLQ